jgi:protein-S-isoprenylcysteine O-methyltransferase Ste14
MKYPWSEIVFALGLIAYITIRGSFIRQTKSMETVDRRVDLLEQTLLAFVLAGNLLLPLAYLLTPVLAFANCGLPTSAHVAGTLVIPIALWMFWRSHSDLGRNWSPTLEIRENHELVRHGIYAHIRHPMYAAILLFGLSQGLLLNNWLAGWSGMASFVLLYLFRAPREEQMLIEHFSSEYKTYAQQTGRLFPKIRNR